MESTKVFLVEDDEFYGFLLDKKLQEISNFDLRTFVTGESCLENLYLEPAIIILDYSLPGIDGLETLIQIRNSNSSAEVIFLSGNEDPALIKDCIAAGASEYIVKDKEVALKVFRSVNSILDQKNENEEHASGGSFLGGLFRKKKK